MVKLWFLCIFWIFKYLSEGKAWNYSWVAFQREKGLEVVWHHTASSSDQKQSLLLGSDGSDAFYFPRISSRVCSRFHQASLCFLPVWIISLGSHSCCLCKNMLLGDWKADWSSAFLWISEPNCGQFQKLSSWKFKEYHVNHILAQYFDWSL